MYKKYLILTLVLAVLLGICACRNSIFLSLDKVRLSGQALAELRLENQGLEQKVKELENKLSLKSQPLLTAQVYSRYPFNDNQTIIIDVGLKDGVKAGMPVLAAENYLLGKVVKVKNDVSEVQTIFSPDWKSGVKIIQAEQQACSPVAADLTAGQAGVEAVLAGGWPPKLELIPADAKIGLGDKILNTSPDLPLNFLMGKISGIVPQAEASLQQAKLLADYDPNKLRRVFIITDYEGIN